jgi:ComF family protein
VAGHEHKAGWLHAFATGLANVIWPPRSLVSQPGTIEGDAWGRLAFLEESLCFRCGFLLPAYVGEQAVCGACAFVPPLFDPARATLVYNDDARHMVLQLKRAGRRDGLPVFGVWMAQAAAPLIAEADVIAPVLWHWRRLASRGFNQAAWLAQALSARCGLPWRPALLQRPRKPGGQAGLSRSDRGRQVAGAFRVSRGHTLAGKTILLVDDVITTGATADACARALKKAGAAQVHMAALARVVKGAEASI